MKKVLLSVLAILILSASAFAASKGKLLHVFQGAPDGTTAYTGLITDSHGNLYGVTGGGGATSCVLDGLGCGIVFELVAPSNPSGVWQEVILYSFSGPDGAFPGSSLTFDQEGNLYGTASAGGDIGNPSCGGYGCGLVFELSPPSQPGGSWTETVLHTFEAGMDGSFPSTPVIFDPNGNLYGMTGGNDTISTNVAYELSPSSSGWTETIVYTFTGLSDAEGPVGSIVLDRAGNLYGTTQGAYPNPSAIAFELSPVSPGQQWTETTIANIGFYGTGLVRGIDGNLYGSASGHDPVFPGNVFQLVLSDGIWTQNVIYTFNHGTGISDPQAVTVDPNLNIYLTTGVPLCGDVYKFTAMPGNTWTPSQLYHFSTNREAGCQPYAALAIGKWGALYGTTSQGGTDNDGVVFAVAP